MSSVLKHLGTTWLDKERKDFQRLMPPSNRAMPVQPACHGQETSSMSWIVLLNADFELGGAWAGVSQLVENAYLSLSEIQQDALIREHLYELYMALPKHRGSIRPEYLCLADIASGSERTRFYPVGRAYRIIHGLVSLILEWKQALQDQGRWLILVQEFGKAEHLATRFFMELARRGESARIEIAAYTWRTPLDAELQMQALHPAITSAPGVEEPAVHDFPDEWEEQTLEQRIAGGGDLFLEQEFPRIIAYYKRKDDRLAVARIALKMLVMYNRYGYYHEARHFLDSLLPLFDVLVGGNERERMKFIGQIYTTMVTTGDPSGAMRIVTDLGVPHLSKPDLLAIIDYIRGVHYIRHAESRNLQLAEKYLLESERNIAEAEGDPDLNDYPFWKAFIDNGLALLRGRQGRHQEAVDLCQAGYASMTEAFSEGRFVLHRSVLQYNTAQVFVALGRLEEGLEYYERAIAMDRYYSDYYHERGNILQALERYPEALKNYTQALAYSPPYPEVYFNKGLCHTRLERWDDALDCFSFTLELDPSQPEAFAQRAEVYDELGKTEEALADYNSAIELGYDSTAARVNRAVLHFRNGTYDLALSDMNYVIALGMEDPVYYENRATIYEAMNQPELCARDLNTATRLREA